MKSYLALIAIDLRLALRQRTVIFFNYLFPLIFFFTFGVFLGANGNAAKATLPEHVNHARDTGQWLVRRRDTRLAGTRDEYPASLQGHAHYTGTILVSSMVTGWIIFMPYILLLLMVSHFWYHMPWPGHALALVVFISIGLVAFRAIGLVIASVANTMQEGTILVQLLYFPMLFLSGATFPVEQGPRILRIISGFVPATYLVNGMNAIMLKSASLNDVWKPAGALIITLIVGFVVGTNLFRWEKEEKIRGNSEVVGGPCCFRFL